MSDRIDSSDQFRFLKDFHYNDSMSLFFSDQMQKFESTRNKIGFQYSNRIEPYVRDVLVSKFHTSVVILEIQNLEGGEKSSDLYKIPYQIQDPIFEIDDKMLIFLSQSTNLL